jgi:hypothetical protein
MGSGQKFPLSAMAFLQDKEGKIPKESLKSMIKRRKYCQSQHISGGVCI